MSSLQSSRSRPIPSRHAKRFACGILLAFLICAAPLFSGCSKSGSAAEPGTLNFLIESMPTNLDPRIGTDAQSEEIDGLIFDGLVQRNAQMDVAPDLAQSWETPNPLTYIFHLRHGVKFHDGRPFTSADVKYTLDSIMSGKVQTPKRGAFELVQSVDAPDPYTVVIHLREPYASFIFNLSRLAIGIVPKDSGSNFAQDPIGTGPFKFVSMTTDEQVVLERNSNYFGKIPNITRVRMRVVPEAIVRALELRKGTADVGGVDSLTPDMIVTLTKDPDIVVDEQPGTQLAYIGFNFNDPILSHREVRQALAYATDRESLIRYLLRGQARPASSVLPPSNWAYDPNVKKYSYDPAEANRLLDAAGFHRGPDGVRFHITLKTSTEESARLLGEALANQWSRVGVVLDLRSLEPGTFYADISRGSFQLYTLRWTGYTNDDPDIFDYVYNSKRMPPLGANRGHYVNPALDSLLNQQRGEMDRAKRKQLIWKIQEIVAEDEPYIDLWYIDNTCVHRARVTNVHLSPGGDYNFLDQVELK
ncbi:MAG TPA: ABC transporter substrate-binding protein [Candidatus Dormibacteraeota bacterium]|nr:ABC transporter substrate-binding protein [Candidatus Dormibacteraeota bacterium]